MVLVLLVCQSLFTAVKPALAAWDRDTNNLRHDGGVCRKSPALPRLLQHRDDSSRGGFLGLNAQWRAKEGGRKTGRMEGGIIMGTSGQSKTRAARAATANQQQQQQQRGSVRRQCGSSDNLPRRRRRPRSRSRSRSQPLLQYHCHFQSLVTSH